jgi:hypothetical protein
MWIICDGRMLHYGLVQQADPKMCTLFNLYLIATKIEYKKINIFYIDPLPDLRPDLETSGYIAFTYMFGFPKFQITTELWCRYVYRVETPLARMELCMVVQPLRRPNYCTNTVQNNSKMNSSSDFLT